MASKAKKPKRIGTAGIIFINRDKEFLLVTERDCKTLSFPKGGVDEGETFKEGAERELLEETGVILNADTDTFIFEKRLQRGLYFVFVTTREISTFNPTTPQEICGVGWMNIFDLEENREICNKDLKSFLNEYQEFEKELFLNSPPLVTNEILTVNLFDIPSNEIQNKGLDFKKFLSLSEENIIFIFKNVTRNENSYKIEFISLSDLAFYGKVVTVNIFEIPPYLGRRKKLKGKNEMFVFPFSTYCISYSNSERLARMHRNTSRIFLFSSPVPIKERGLLFYTNFYQVDLRLVEDEGMFVEEIPNFFQEMEEY